MRYKGLLVRFTEVLRAMWPVTFAFCLSRAAQWPYDLFSMNRALTLDIKATSGVAGNTTLF
jgi:hypothetical protein